MVLLKQDDGVEIRKDTNQKDLSLKAIFPILSTIPAKLLQLITALQPRSSHEPHFYKEIYYIKFPLSCNDHLFHPFYIANHLASSLIVLKWSLLQWFTRCTVKIKKKVGNEMLLFKHPFPDKVIVWLLKTWYIIFKNSIPGVSRKKVSYIGLKHHDSE